VGKVILEFARFLGLEGGTPLDIGSAKEGVVILGCGMILALVGYKIKGVLGSIVAVVFGMILFLFYKGYF
jgi:hypothetical protein